MTTAQDNKLIPWAHGLALEVLNDPAIEEAKRVAAIVVKLIIASEEDAAKVNDLWGKVSAGRKKAEAERKRIAKVLDDAKKQGLVSLVQTVEALEAVEKACSDATTRWLRERAAKKAEEERVAREEQMRVEREAFAAGESAPPPMEAEPPKDVSLYTGKPLVRGSNGGTASLTTYTHIEMLDPHEVAAYDPSLLELREGGAIRAYKDALKSCVLMDCPIHPAGGIVWHGMRVWTDEQAVRR